MNTWITSDLHLFHENIIVYCNRAQSDVEEMNDHIVKCWRETVQPGDRVIVVGDLSASLRNRKEDLAQIISGLPGNKVLVRGNHDHQPDEWYIAAGFSLVTNWLFEDGFLFVHKPANQQNVDAIRAREECDPRLVVHGHIHAAGPEIPGHFNVAWDRHGRLINLQEIRNANSDS